MNTVHVCEVIDEVMKKRGYIKHHIHLGKYDEVNYLGPGGGVCVPQEAIIEVLAAFEKESARLP